MVNTQRTVDMDKRVLTVTANQIQLPTELLDRVLSVSINCKHGPHSYKSKPILKDDIGSWKDTFSFELHSRNLRIEFLLDAIRKNATESSPNETNSERETLKYKKTIPHRYFGAKTREHVFKLHKEDDEESEEAVCVKLNTEPHALFLSNGNNINRIYVLYGRPLIAKFLFCQIRFETQLFSVCKSSVSIICYLQDNNLPFSVASTPRDSTDGTETDIASVSVQMEEMNVSSGLVTSQEIDEAVIENRKDYFRSCLDLFLTAAQKMKRKTHANISDGCSKIRQCNSPSTWAKASLKYCSQSRKIRRVR